VVAMVMMMVVMVVICRCRHLRLRCDRSREAEDNDKPKKKLFHAWIDGDSPGWITKPTSHFEHANGRSRQSCFRS
jgi:hypothetical protein